MTQENSTAQSIVAYIFILIPVAFAITITGLFGGLSASFFPEMSFENGFWAMNLMAGTGWVLYFIIVWIGIDEETRSDYLGYLIPAVLLPGLLLLIPFVIYQALAASQFVLIPLITIAGSLIVMFWRHYQKLRFLDLPLKWYFIWIVCLALPAVAWLWYFQAIKGWI